MHQRVRSSAPLAHGGLDMLVLNAGIFGQPQHQRACDRLMA